MSTIPNKLLADLIPETEKALNLSIAATDTALKALIEKIDPEDEILDTSLKKKLLEDKTTQDILQALATKSYQKKFEEQYPGIKITELAVAKKQSKYPLQSKKGNTFPIFGMKAIKMVLDHYDENLQHQGLDALMNRIRKENIEFYHKDDGQFKKIEEKEVQEFNGNIRDCDQCNIVQEIKSHGTTREKFTKLHSEEDILKALVFADKFHTGKNSNVNL